MTSAPAKCLIAFALLATTSLAQPIPPGLAPSNFLQSGYSGLGQQPYEPKVDLYNGSFAYQAFPGGAQQAIYYDGEIPIPTVTGMYAQIVNLTACGFSLPHYHPSSPTSNVVEMNYVLEGEGVIAGLLLQTDATGTVATWATGVGKGGVATVTPNSIHYASNPGCGTAVLLQVLSGLEPGYTSVPYIDLPAALIAQDADAVQYAFGMTDAQLQTAISSVRPLFAVNTTCLAICNGASKAPTSG